MFLRRAKRHRQSHLQRFTLAMTMVILSASIVTGCEKSITVDDAAKKPAANAVATPAPTPASSPASALPAPSLMPAASAPSKAPTPISREAKITTAIELAIAGPATAGYAPIPAGTKLLGVEIVASKIRLNFNKALLVNGTGHKLEDAVKQLTNPISDIVTDMANVEYQLLIEGKPLAEFL